MAVYTEAPVNKEKHGDSDTPSLHVNYMMTCIWLLDKRVYSEDKMMPWQIYLPFRHYRKNGFKPALGALISWDHLGAQAFVKIGPPKRPILL